MHHCSLFISEGDNDSGVDESTQGNVSLFLFLSKNNIVNFDILRIDR